MTLAALRRGDLAGVRSLQLKCGLTEFPDEIFGLADTLEVLDLSGNALESLPANMGRLRKLRVIFCSGNRFQVLPPSLGDCASLSQIGFRNAGLTELPGESLPPQLRWLTLTDNHIARLPHALGARPQLQKLMLAGNDLNTVPDSLAGAAGLELLRLSANRLSALPGWVSELPNLAWPAWAGNLFGPSHPDFRARLIAWPDLQLERLLGEGASGAVHRALWRAAKTDPPEPVALKLFKGRMTSDGLPDSEMAASLAAGPHPHLTTPLGRLTGHPEDVAGLIMPLLPTHWRALAGPPSLESCSRDVYDPDLRLSPPVVLQMARAIAAATAHLHARGLLHGDLYAHNVLWDGAAGDCVLSDFGAASFLPQGAQSLALQRVEVRAWGILLGELLDRCDAAMPSLARLHRQCVTPDVWARPLMAEVVTTLNAVGPG